MGKKPEIGIVMGSDSDWNLVKEAVATLKGFGIGTEVNVMSAHRTPDIAAIYAKSAARRGLKVIIAAAGGAAHLGGMIAAHTCLPVIGIPVSSGALDGMDALLATVQMPAGIPVATVTLGSAGPVNAAVLAAQIVAVVRPEVARKLAVYKKSLKSKVLKGNKRVQAEIRQGQ